MNKLIQYFKILIIKKIIYIFYNFFGKIYLYWKKIKKKNIKF